MLKKISLSERVILTNLLLGIFSVGISVSLISPILIEISKQVEVSVTTAGLIFSVVPLGWVCGSATINILSKHIRRINIFGFTLLTEALLIIAVSFSKNILITLVIFFCLGLCYGGLEVTIYTITVDLFREAQGLLINICQMLMGLGYFAGPLLSSLIVGHNLSWRLSAYIVALMILAIFLFFTVIRNLKIRNISDEKTIPQKHNSGVKLLNVFGNFSGIELKMLMLFMFISITSTFTFSGLNVWMPTFLRVSRGSDVIFAGGSVSFLWLAVTFGRFITGVASKYFRLEKIIALLSSAFLVFTAGTIFINNKTISIIFFVLSGLSFSGIIPSMFALGCIKIPSKKDTVLSILVSTASTGAFLGASSISLIYYGIGKIEPGFYIAVVSIFLSSAASVTYYLRSRTGLAAKVS